MVWFPITRYYVYVMASCMGTISTVVSNDLLHRYMNITISLFQDSPTHTTFQGLFTWEKGICPIRHCTRGANQWPATE